MMVKLKQSWLVWSLLLGLVLVNGLLAVPAVAHADHHARHEAGTHSTGLCAWQCAAGQSIDTAVVVFNSFLQVVEPAEMLPVDGVIATPPVSRLFRGPPAFRR